jgi:hypothetical protein
MIDDEETTREAQGAIEVANDMMALEEEVFLTELQEA